MTLARLGDRLLIVAAGAALFAGLAGAFIGLSSTGFWLDELWTAWTIGDGDGVAAVAARAITDVHPPLYYLAVDGWAAVFGRSEAGLRSFSAVTAVAAVLLFGVGTRAVYSLPARLVAMVVAVSSAFWFDQSQTARQYGLGMLVGSALLVLGLRLVARDRAGAPLAGSFAALVAVAFFGAFVHFYLVVLGTAVCLALLPFCRRLRVSLLLAALALVGVAFAYVALVLTPNSVVAVGSSWIRSDAAWFQLETRRAVKEGIGGYGRNIIILIGVAAIIAAVARRPQAPVRLDDPRLFPPLVPVLVLAGGIASSLILAPNLTARNLLVSAPFLWATLALGYDIGVARLDRLRAPANLALAVMLVLTMARLPGRFEPRTTQYRESAAWIAAQPECAGARIMVLTNDRQTMKPGANERHALHDYGYYLPGHRLYPVFVDALLAGRAAPNPTCPVIAWSAHHLVGAAAAEKVRARLAEMIGHPVQTRAFPVANRIDDWRTAFVFVAAPEKSKPGSIAPPPPPG